jgi:hypothetical protein
MGRQAFSTRRECRAHLGIGGRATGAILLLMLSACAPRPQYATARSGGPHDSGPGVHVVLTADQFAFTAADQFCQSLVTAEVVVGGHGTPHWNTPDGTLPATIRTPGEVLAHNYRIYTPVMFTRFAPLLDHRTVPTHEYLTVGGQVGPDSYRIDLSPTLAGTGGHYVVVLAPSTPPSGATSDVTLVVGWAYLVDAHGIVVLQQAGNPHEPGVGTPQPAITIPLTDLAQRLAQCT